MRTWSWRWMVAVVGVLLSGVLVSAERRHDCRQSQLPANIEVSPHLTGPLQHLYEQSPTFRAQCQRLGRAENLRVFVRLNTSLPGQCRAITTIQRRGRTILADVQLPPGHSLVEMAGHEFEHLLEQVEGLDLRTLARTRGSGVRETHREVFETERAIKVGRVVADEVRASMQAN